MNGVQKRAGKCRVDRGTGDLGYRELGGGCVGQLTCHIQQRQICTGCVGHREVFVLCVTLRQGGLLGIELPFWR